MTQVTYDRLLRLDMSIDFFSSITDPSTLVECIDKPELNCLIVELMNINKRRNEIIKTIYDAWDEDQ